MARIFLSYRRDDSGGWAGRLYDRLSQHFGQDHVFMDINTIEPGWDFVEVIEQAVGSCDALVALIGRQWLTITDASGQRRLDNPEDYVRLEIATALARNVRVIPALVEGAPMLRSSDLPDALKMLARRNALEISDTRFHYDTDKLITALDNVLKDAEHTYEKSEAPVVHTTPSSGADIIGRPEPASRGEPRAVLPWEESSTARQPFEPEMIFIPAGEFLMGSDPQRDKGASDNEQPQHRVYLPDYYLAKTLVTNSQYGAFVAATGHQVPERWRNRVPPLGEEDHPVVNVHWYDAMSYCLWLIEATGKPYSLPSEAEWEKSARGTDGRIYPWGDQWDYTRCNSRATGNPQTTIVYAYPQGVSPYGVLDLVGNVGQWTRSLGGSAYPYRSADGRENLAAPPFVARVVRSGAYYPILGGARCARRNEILPTKRNQDVGFRPVMRLAS